MWILLGLAFGFVLAMALLLVPAVWLAALLRDSAPGQQKATLPRRATPFERRAKPIASLQRRAKSASS